MAHLALEPKNDLTAWVEGRRNVPRPINEAGDMEIVNVFSPKNTVSFLSFHRSFLVVGDDIGAISFYDQEGTLLESQDVDGGVQNCCFMDLKAVVLSGMGEVHLIQYERPQVNLSRLLKLNDVLHFAAHSGRIYVAEQGGRVVAMDESKVVWKRPARGEHGERITGLGLTEGGRLFLTREGHALVAGEEEAIEFELWSNDALQVRYDQRMRLLTSAISPRGAILGFDDGTVHRLLEDGTLEAVLNTGHCVLAQNTVERWLQVHGFTSTGWPMSSMEVEHQGMPEMFCYHPAHRRLVFWR